MNAWARGVLSVGLAAVVGLLGGGAPAADWDWVALHEAADREQWDALRGPARKGELAPERLYIAGLTAFTAHDVEGAEFCFNGVLENAPDAYGASWGLAEAARRRHEYDAARASLEQLLAEHPDFAPALLSLAYVHFIQKRFEKGLDIARTVVDLPVEKVDTPNRARALVLMAGARALLAHHGGLIDKLRYGTRVFSALEEARAMRPNGPEVLLGLGGFYLLAPGFVGGDIDRGLELLQKAVEIDPKLPEAHVRLAQAWRLHGNEAKYAEHMQRARELDPRSELIKDIESGTCDFVCVEPPK